MFCPNCGFEIKDPEVTTCPECSCILSRNIPESDENEELFEDIDRILSSEDLDSDAVPKTGDPLPMQEESAYPNQPEQSRDNTEEDRIEGSDTDFENFEKSSNDEGPVGILEIDDYIEQEDFEETPEILENTSPENIKSSGETEEEPEDNEDMEEEEIEPGPPSKTAPILLFVFLLIIAAGAGVFYLKIKQPPSPPVTKITPAKKEGAILKSLLRKGEKQVVEKTDPKKSLIEKPGNKIPIKKPVVSAPAKKPVEKKDEIAEKKSPEPRQEKPKIKSAKKKGPPSLKNNFWIDYIPGGTTYYTIQISSMTIRSFAESHLKNLRKKGYPAYIISTKTKEGKPLYKLRIGRYQTRAEAKTAAGSFYKKEKMNYIIINSKAKITL